MKRLEAIAMQFVLLEWNNALRLMRPRITMLTFSQEIKCANFICLHKSWEYFVMWYFRGYIFWITLLISENRYFFVFCVQKRITSRVTSHPGRHSIIRNIDLPRVELWSCVMKAMVVKCVGLKYIYGANFRSFYHKILFLWSLSRTFPTSYEHQIHHSNCHRSLKFQLQK